ncbi:hypothetical protein PQO03_15135 [Lentisphaera profundi]|uniref:Zinc finger/thioredoxin putative domain-containing protein n=1 Tax=Lentisphaera profundi TaxID=1658616 RepID=A0ABY7VY50_9BACT|nr:hypothetical protein [Lentisphaera profundi]WDE99168.1 hypothetical protein PQO03_15135 [Lentisphaera profundi]
MKFACKHCGFEHEVRPSAIDQQMNCNSCGRLNIIPSHNPKVVEKSRTKTLVYFEPGLLFTSLIIFGHCVHPTLSLSFTLLSTAIMLFLLRNPVNSLPFFTQYTALQIRKFSSDQYLIPLWLLMLLSRIPESNILFGLLAALSIIYAGISSVALHFNVDNNIGNQECKPMPNLREILYPFYRRELIGVDEEKEEVLVQTPQSHTQLKIKNKRMKKMDVQIQVDKRFNEWLEDEVERFTDYPSL